MANQVQDFGSTVQVRMGGEGVRGLHFPEDLSLCPNMKDQGVGEGK